MLRQFSVTVLLTAILTIPAFTQIQLKVTLSGEPSSVRIEKKNLKYGKYGVFCMVWDDRSHSAADAFPIMPSFTDGAGNDVPYTATVAANGVNRYYEDAEGLSFPQMKDLIDAGWAIACHGYIHDVKIWEDQGFTVLDNVTKNREYFFDKFKEQGIEYVLRTGAVPNADEGYQIAWRQIGSLCGTSEGSFDGIPATPYANWANNSIGDISNFTGEYRPLARAMKDVIDQAGQDHMKEKLQALVAASTAASNKILTFGSHRTDNSFLQPALNYLKSTSNDHIWVTSMHELMEYGETTGNTNVSYSLSGNILTITLDQHVPDINRWRDISLGLNTGQQIEKIEFTGADRVTFNSTTGLINVFKKKLTGFSLSSPGSVVLPLHFTSFTVSGHELTWTTADKENLSHFEIERSADGKHFTTIGNTTSETFRDVAPGQENYYRIKAIEKNGKFLYSKTVHHTNAMQHSAVLSRQGSGWLLKFYSPRQQSTSVQVFNTAGQSVSRSDVKANLGWNSYTINIPPAAGLYVVKVLKETMLVSM